MSLVHRCALDAESRWVGKRVWSGSAGTCVRGYLRPCIAGQRCPKSGQHSGQHPVLSVAGVTCVCSRRGQRWCAASRWAATSATITDPAATATGPARVGLAPAWAERRHPSLKVGRLSRFGAALPDGNGFLATEAGAQRRVCADAGRWSQIPAGPGRWWLTRRVNRSDNLADAGSAHPVTPSRGHLR